MRTSLFQKVMHRKLTPIELYLLCIIIVYTAIVAVKNPLFFSLETLFDMILSGSVTMVLAVGVLLVLLSGGIDVSFTAVAVVSGYIAVKVVLAAGVDSILWAFVIAIICGSILGAINAILIHWLRLSTLIITLGTMSAFHGLSSVILGTHEYPPSEMPKSMVAFGSANLLTVQNANGRYGLTVFLPIVIGVVAITWFILYRTMLGRGVFAIGSSEESASRLGISIFRTKLFVYSFTGALAGLAGILSFSEVKYVNPSSMVGTELVIIAAAVIGGAKLTGGEGTILGVFLGVVLFQLFQRTLVFLGLSSSWNDFFFGAVLLISLSVMYRRQRLADRRNLVFADA